LWAFWSQFAKISDLYFYQVVLSFADAVAVYVMYLKELMVKLVLYLTLAYHFQNIDFARFLSGICGF
jgi:hypothetical protein